MRLRPGSRSLLLPLLLVRDGAFPHPRHLTGDVPVRLIPTLALSASAPPAARRVPAAVRAARRPAIVRAPPLLNIHAARAPRPAPSPAGLGLGVRFRSFFLPGKERGSCFLSPQNIFSVSRFSSSLTAATAPSLPASLHASAPASRVIFVSLPRAHSLNSRRRRGPTLRARPPGARRGARAPGPEAAGDARGPDGRPAPWCERRRPAHAPSALRARPGPAENRDQPAAAATAPGLARRSPGRQLPCEEAPSAAWPVTEINRETDILLVLFCLVAKRENGERLPCKKSGGHRPLLPAGEWPRRAPPRARRERGAGAAPWSAGRSGAAAGRASGAAAPLSACVGMCGAAGRDPPPTPPPRRAPRPPRPGRGLGRWGTAREEARPVCSRPLSPTAPLYLFIVVLLLNSNPSPPLL